MVDAAAAGPAPVRREYRLALALVIATVLFRAAVFVLWEGAHFDADQAITGLMAKHLAALRAFPVFWYGQSYMLAVEAWLAAPLFALAGASVLTLKLPLVGINVAIAWLLLRGFVHDAGLRPMVAAVPTLFFALPSVGISARLVEANGGNVEPFLYVLLLWALRHRPAWCGFVLGLGFLHREFTLYGFFALLLIEAARRTLFTREGILRRLATLRAAAEVWLVVYWVKQYSSAAGPGTSLADLHRPHDNISELVSRICIEPSTAMTGLSRLFTLHWPVLFGIDGRPVSDFGVNGTVSHAGPWAAFVLVALVGIAIVSGWRAAARQRVQPRDWGFTAFLLATAAFSIAGYVVGRCGQLEFFYTRYEMLSLLGVAGLVGAGLQAGPSLRRPVIALSLGWFAITAVPHVGLWVDYLRDPPQNVRRLTVRHLEARGAMHAVSDYWIAYPIAFLSDERIVVASSDVVRIQEYEQLVAAQPGGVVRISRDPCVRGRQIVPGLHICEP